jgi:hypothetical protein
VNPQLDGGSGVTVQPHHIPALTVIVHKDETGYGMKVSGDKPVYVQSVKEGKSAFVTFCCCCFFIKAVNYVLPELTFQNGKGRLSRTDFQIKAPWVMISLSRVQDPMRGMHFSTYLILSAAVGSRVYTASNRN